MDWTFHPMSALARVLDRRAPNGTVTRQTSVIGHSAVRRTRLRPCDLTQNGIEIGAPRSAEADIVDVSRGDPTGSCSGLAGMTGWQLPSVITPRHRSQGPTPTSACRGPLAVPDVPPPAARRRCGKV